MHGVVNESAMRRRGHAGAERARMMRSNAMMGGDRVMGLGRVGPNDPVVVSGVGVGGEYGATKQERRAQKPSFGSCSN
jgi:hypothetical protein